MIRVTGMVTAAQSKKVRRRSVRSRTRPIAMRLGGDPIGMPTATDDAQVSMSSSAIGNRLWRGSPRRPMPARRPAPTGSIIAVVAVLLTHREIAQVMVPTLASTRPGVRVAQRRARIAKAKRRSRPRLAHGLGQDEAAHEEEDHWIRVGSEHHLGGRDAEPHAQCRREQGGDGKRERLREPVHDDPGEDGGEEMGFAAEPGPGPSEHGHERNRPRGRAR